MAAKAGPTMFVFLICSLYLLLQILYYYVRSSKEAGETSKCSYEALGIYFAVFMDIGI